MARRPIVVTLLALAVLGGLTRPAAAQGGETPPDADEGAVGQTPPRLSFVDGEVSFHRPGVLDWMPAALNTPLAPGDELYTGPRGNFELQIGSRAFVRAWGGTYLGLVNHEPDFLQFRVTAGHASLDLRTLDPGRTVELDTPNGVFTIEHTGYYRVDVGPDTTTFISRRGGRATVTPAGAATAAVTASEQVVVTGTETARVETYVAPELDVWDRWNYARTDHLIEAVSLRYVSPGVYGADTLDHYGTWRVVPTYGPVWVPTAVPAGWAPYSTGTWIWDPYYRWTWVDAAPWGWAPYHYGRWVFVDRVWAWAPGPIVAVPAYSPALVAFFGGAAAVGWVALSWGEPCLPWWGPVGFIGRPWWAGWGGPRIVNNVVISRTTVVHETNITVYQNIAVREAFVAVHRDRFGGGDSVAGARLARVDREALAPLRETLAAAPRVVAPAPGAPRASRPPEAERRRPVIATRAPRETVGRLPLERPGAPAAPAVPLRIVPAPERPSPAIESRRPPFGPSRVERQAPPVPPRAPERRPEVRAPGAPVVPRRVPETTAGPAPGVSRPAPSRTPEREAPRPGAPLAVPRPGGSERLQPEPAPRFPERSAPGAPAPGATRPALPAEPAPAPGVSRRVPQVTPAPGPGRPSPPARTAPAPGIRSAPRPLPGEPANRLYMGRDRTPSPTPSPFERRTR